MNPAIIAQSHFGQGRVMQLGTVQNDGRPRVTSVYYIAVDNKTIYWMSEPDRRHSINSMSNRRVAGAIAIKTDHPVMGLQFSGSAVEVTNIEEAHVVSKRYNEKYNGIANGFYERFKTGTNKHHLYKMIIGDLELFDEVNFPGGKIIDVVLD